jgi:isoleucyl-tRNA synthetase
LNKFNPDPGFFRKSIGFPAEFIGEGLDQTRGWFYSMLVLSVALFGESSYKNVIVNGIILASDGQKMSKRLKNYPDPMLMVDKYGADALRYYLLSSPVVKAEDLCFLEAGVDEIMKKILQRLDNVRSFYEMYSKESAAPVKNFVPVSENILDQWILARLNQLILEITKAANKYELDRATRPVMDFVDDLSTWYLRRSRDRFKSDNQKDKNQAIETTRFVLEELAKVIAPVMPFYAEDLYQKVKSFAGAESVHLASWSEINKLTKAEEDVIANMVEIRKLVSLGLEARSKANIKVRQPLSSLKCKYQNEKLLEKEVESYKELIKDEVNVKEVIFDNTITEAVELDVNITTELKEEGNVRELTRAIQELRKTEKLNLSDIVSLKIKTGEKGKALVQKFEVEIKKTTLLKNLIFSDVDSGNPVKIEDMDFELKISR